ncbi:uncharacterized protein LOC128655883 [Bombina bombina]|uniref:uncharacterized protein LOC128655883 n=1 Tax=Bombina bombina TaxID=8345 RepID=UPI00235A7F4F|nr:uncharacterized protein LOC128655883 [Bombina bombina]
MVPQEHGEIAGGQMQETHVIIPTTCEVTSANGHRKNCWEQIKNKLYFICLWIVKHWGKCLLILVGVFAFCLAAYFVWKHSSNATDTNVVNNSPKGTNINGTTSPSITANWTLCNGKEIANFLKEMTHNDSLHKCNRIGGQLPTKDEIQNMTQCIKHGEDYHIQQHSPIQDGQCEFYNTDSKDPVKLACDTTRFLVCQKQLASSGTSESSKKY